MINAFTSIGIENIVGNSIAFINFPRDFLIGKKPIPLPAGRVVLEVLENIKIDQELIDSLRKLARQGYRIALDDVSHPDNVQPLLNTAHIIKMELPKLTRTQLATYIAYFHQCGLKVLAEKVETLEQYECCKSVGVDYFQGYFLCRPNLVKGRQLKPSILAKLRLLQKIQDPYVDFHDIEEVVAMDVALSYKLLRLVNSAVYGLRTKIESIRQAIALLGLEQVLKWFTLFFIMEMGDKPPELLNIALIRAQMCELTAKSLNQGDTDKYFLVGLLSVLDAMLDLPREQVINSLPLADAIKDALLAYKGVSGSILQSIEAYEQGDWEKIRHSPIQPQILRESYLQSLQWTQKVMSEMSEIRDIKQ